MQKVSDFLGVIQCFGDHHRIISLLWFASNLFGMLQCKLIAKFAASFLMERVLRRKPIITCISFWTLAVLEGAARWLVFFA